MRAIVTMMIGLALSGCTKTPLLYIGGNVSNCIFCAAHDNGQVNKSGDPPNIKGDLARAGGEVIGRIGEAIIKHRRQPLKPNEGYR